MGEEGGDIRLDITEGGLWAPANPPLIDSCGDGLRCGSIGEGTRRCSCGEGIITERRDGDGDGCKRRPASGDIPACLIIMAVGVGIDGGP